MFKKYQLRDYKFILVFYLIVLSVIGILVIGSAREEVQPEQISGLFIGLVLMVIVSFIDYHWIIDHFYWVLYVFNLGLLLWVKYAGYSVNNAQRWIKIRGFQFQPSDLTKIILILFFAKFFQKYKDKLNTPQIIISSLILLGIPLYLIKGQPDLSTTIVLAAVFCAMIFVAGLSYKIVCSVLAVGIPGVIFAVNYIIQKAATGVELPYQMKRIMAWLQPEAYLDLARQQKNSITAIGSGMLYGKGLNNNVISSVKNGNFVSECQTDFIFSVVGEELGFLGSCVVIILLAMIIFECVWIGRNAADISGRLIGCGIASLIAFQAFVNIAVTIGVMPNTGIPLPFVSYGRTSLISLFLGMGVVLNVGLQKMKY